MVHADFYLFLNYQMNFDLYDQAQLFFLIIDKVKESSDERCYVQDKFKCNVCHERTNRGFVPCKIHFKILNDLGMSKL